MKWWWWWMAQQTNGRQQERRGPCRGACICMHGCSSTHSFPSHLECRIARCLTVVVVRPAGIIMCLQTLNRSTLFCSIRQSFSFIYLVIISYLLFLQKYLVPVYLFTRRLYYYHTHLQIMQIDFYVKEVMVIRKEVASGRNLSAMILCFSVKQISE